MKIKKILHAAIAAAGIVSMSAKAVVVNIDFTKSSSAYSGTAAADDTGTVWNLAEANSTLTSLDDSNGNSTSIGLSTSGASGAWSDNDGANVSGGNLTEAFGLMEHYSYLKESSPSITHLFAGLTAGQGYDLYVYAYGDSVGQNVCSSVDNGTTWLQTSDPTGLTTLVEGRQYVLFESVLADSNGEITLLTSLPSTTSVTDLDASANYASINGLQLATSAAVPEPATFVLAGLLGFLLLMRRSRS